MSQKSASIDNKISNKEYEEILKNNEALIENIVQKFKPKTNEEYEDMTQCGRIALWEAARRYDKSRNTKLITIAYNRIYWNIFSYLRNRNRKRRLKSITNYKLEKISIGNLGAPLIEEVIDRKLTQEEYSITEMLIGGFTQREIAEKLEIPIGRVRRLIRLVRRKRVS